MVSRFAVERSYYRPSDNSVRFKAFMPAREDKATSVFRLAGMAHEAKVAHANEHVIPHLGKPLLGYAEVPADTVLAASLSLDDEVPPPLHANICSWPDDPDEQKKIAALLAEAATWTPA